ncbi:MAG TPA: hypothetical protein VF426_05525 [Marmoricola sp.]
MTTVLFLDTAANSPWTWILVAVVIALSSLAVSDVITRSRQARSSAEPEAGGQPFDPSTVKRNRKKVAQWWAIGCIAIGLVVIVMGIAYGALFAVVIGLADGAAGLWLYLRLRRQLRQDPPR